MGFETGKYGAYVTIPATFSQSVESLNGTPQASHAGVYLDFEE